MESMGALVREGHPLFIGEGGGGASANSMQGVRERRNRFAWKRVEWVSLVELSELST